MTNLFINILQCSVLIVIVQENHINKESAQLRRDFHLTVVEGLRESKDHR